MAFLMSAVDVHAPTGVWEWFIVNVFGFISNYGWRIVVLVIFLKLLLSPLDFYQRYKMRKNQRITEALKPQMDKLEKQYGADKQVLQQKQMELQKSSGFSYMSACLPLIITLVLFITFFTALRSVSSYMEFKQYVEMYDSYVTAYDATGFEYESRANNGYAISDTYTVTVTGEDGTETTEEKTKEIDYDAIDEWLGSALKDRESIESLLSSDLIKALFAHQDVKIDNYVDVLSHYNEQYGSYREYVEANNGYSSATENVPKSVTDMNLSMSIVMQVRAQEAAREAFKEYRTKFLWIKSLWIADVPWANSVPGLSSFRSTVGKYLKADQKNRVYADNDTLFYDMASENKANDEVCAYNLVTEKVRQDSSLYKTNGYMIMVILVVGLSLLSQFISMRQQKKSGQVASQGMGMVKVMMWIMPIMLGVFAITSSSAFTLYMVTNSIMTLVINLVTTLIVNLMDGGFKHEETKIIKYGRRDPNEKTTSKK